MSINVNDIYITELNDLIEEYKPKINIFMDDYTNIKEYTDKVVELIKIVNNESENYHEHLFFHKSYLGLLLPFKEYKPYNDGFLISNSFNCQFTIADVKTDNNESNRLFIKIIDTLTQIPDSHMDLSIFDILSAIIFENLLQQKENMKYRDFIPVYKGSFVNFVKNITMYNKWDFNDIKNFENDETNYYNPVSISNETEFENLSIFIMYEAINNPISVTEIFTNYITDDNNKLVIEVFNNAYDIYNFLIYLGIEFGFMHNDLHFDNLIYNPKTKKLMLIDFGSSSFAKYINEEDSHINNRILTDYIKLDYDSLLWLMKNKDKAIEKPEVKNKVKGLYENCELFTKCISVKGNGDKYFGIIYDLITFSLHMYIRTNYYINKTNHSEGQKFKTNFDSILNVNHNFENNQTTFNTEHDLDKLIKNYVNVRDNYINKLRCNKTKNHFKMLLEGLSYTAFFLHYTRFKTEKIYDYFQIIDDGDLMPFKDFVIKNVLANYKNELSTDTFLSNFIPRTVPFTGGLSIFTKPKSDQKTPKSAYSLFLNNKSISAQITEESDVDISQTAEAYKKILKYNHSVPKKIKGGKNKKRLLKRYKN